MPPPCDEIRRCSFHLQDINSIFSLYQLQCFSSYSYHYHSHTFATLFDPSHHHYSHPSPTQFPIDTSYIPSLPNPSLFLSPVSLPTSFCYHLHSLYSLFERISPCIHRLFYDLLRCSQLLRWVFSDQNLGFSDTCCYS
ncbi:hypothetical protein MtrunA17_Chr3g0144861 [Medicago truncatula]|uniref:Uncharacterized protein n=1 Tax=Medicago truncatula TaxID=3880 RepID=A0A396J0I0_MEDTR|nr:hypothetical protein MtrunA17_Chr3g0144861 [Medicago truncatula]